jgi:hypothetical protein
MLLSSSGRSQYGRSHIGLADKAKVSFALDNALDKKSPVTCVTGQFFQFQS